MPWSLKLKAKLVRRVLGPTYGHEWVKLANGGVLIFLGIVGSLREYNMFSALHPS